MRKQFIAFAGIICIAFLFTGCVRPPVDIGGNHPCADKINNGTVECNWVRNSKCQGNSVTEAYRQEMPQEEWVEAYRSCVIQFNKTNTTLEHLETFYLDVPNQITDWPRASWEQKPKSQRAQEDFDKVAKNEIRETVEPPEGWFINQECVNDVLETLDTTSFSSDGRKKIIDEAKQKLLNCQRFAATR